MLDDLRNTAQEFLFRRRSKAGSRSRSAKTGKENSGHDGTPAFRHFRISTDRRDRAGFILPSGNRKSNTSLTNFD